MQESGTPQPTQGAEPGGGTDAAVLFTVDQLAEISENPDPVGYDLAGDRAALVPEMKKGGIVTKNQITAFLANICQETDWLKTLEEYGDEAYYRSFLGEEWMYHGRGYIMNTWLDAYQRLSQVLGVDLVLNPDLLAQNKNLAAKAAVWYWNMRDIGPVADQEDFEGVCSLINRGENPPQGPIHGWPERLAAYERAKSVIGTGTEPVTELVTEPPRERTETVAEAWSWPVAITDPWPTSWMYQDRHPTRYTWRDDVEGWARYLVRDAYRDRCWVNTYYDHPEGYWRTETSFDVWGPQGRNDPLDPDLGDEIRDLLFNDTGKPDIDWIIYKRWMWTRRGGVWVPFGFDDFTWHEDHIHVTYL